MNDMNDPIVLGRHSYCNGSIRDYGVNDGKKVVVGNFTAIDVHTRLYLRDTPGHQVPVCITSYPFHRMNKVLNNPSSDGSRFHEPVTSVDSQGDINIGSDVWIQEWATIKSGVTIGHGAVVCQDSHVMDDVEPYAIVSGNPAAKTGMRFDQDTVDILLSDRWWDQDDENIQKLFLDIQPYIQEHVVNWLSPYYTWFHPDAHLGDG